MAPATLQFLASAAIALGITRLEREVEVSDAIKFLQVLRKSAAKERPKLVPTLKGRVGRAQPSSVLFGSRWLACWHTLLLLGRCVVTLWVYWGYLTGTRKKGDTGHQPSGLTIMPPLSTWKANLSQILFLQFCFVGIGVSLSGVWWGQGEPDTEETLRNRGQHDFVDSDDLTK